MSHEYSPSRNSSKRSQDSTANPPAFSSNMITERYSVYNAPTPRPSAPAPTISQQHRRDSYQSGTMHSIRSTTESFSGGDYSNPVSSFTDMSAPSSRQGTLSSQIQNDFATYRQFVQINTQSDQVRQFSTLHSQLDKQPEIDYADSDEIQTAVVKSGHLPSVNHAVVVNRGSVVGSDWPTHAAPQLNGASPPLTNYSTMSTLTHDHHNLVAKQFHHTDSENEPLPPPPKEHQSPSAPYAIVTRKTLPHGVGSFSSEGAKMKYESERCANFIEKCKKMRSTVGHDITTASLIFAVQTFIIMSFFLNLHSTWPIWYILVPIELLLLSTFVVLVMGCLKKKYKWHLYYAIVHFILAISFIALAVVYLLKHDSPIFQTWSDHSKENKDPDGKLFGSETLFGNLDGSIWCIVIGLFVSAVVDVIFCVDLLYKMHQHAKHTKVINGMHKTQTVSTYTESVQYIAPEITVVKAQI